MRKIFFYAIVSFQVFFLAGMSIAYYLIDDFGETIKLATVPVDPQDIFYGDYVTLNYEIGQINANRWEGSDQPSRGEKINVLLEADKNGVYQVKKASNKDIDAKNGEVVLTGKFQQKDAAGKIYRLDYGIGRYYVEDNTGEKYEQQGKLVVTLTVAPWGQKKIVSLQ